MREQQMNKPQAPKSDSVEKGGQTFGATTDIHAAKKKNALPNSSARAMFFSHRDAPLFLMRRRPIEERKVERRDNKARNENEWKKERRDQIRTKVWEEAERTKQMELKRKPT